MKFISFWNSTALVRGELTQTDRGFLDTTTISEDEFLILSGQYNVRYGAEVLN